jgi:monovalent cation/proton antiporter MnhG/PhaG subunit
MSFRDVVVAVLLVLGVGLQLLACLGLVVMRDSFARIHYVAPAGFGVIAVAAAVLVEESFSTIGDKAIATAAVVLLSGPVLAHVTARSARTRRLGSWKSRRPDEVERVPR